MLFRLTLEVLQLEYLTSFKNLILFTDHVKYRQELKRLNSPNSWFLPGNPWFKSPLGCFENLESKCNCAIIFANNCNPSNWGYFCISWIEPSRLWSQLLLTLCCFGWFRVQNGGGPSEHLKSFLLCCYNASSSLNY